MQGGREPEPIEFLDSDPSAFGSQPHSSASGTRHSVRGWKAATAVVGALALAATAILIWHPWRNDAEASWSNRLLVDLPTDRVIHLTVGEPLIGGMGAWGADVGYVFAQPGAVLPFLQGGEGRSASWNSIAADSMLAAFRAADDNSGTPPPSIQGVPGRIDGVGGSVVRISFGPLNGRYYDVTTNGMSKPEALRFAEAVTVEGGQAALTDDSVLLGMEPIGTLDDFNAALSMLNLGFSAPTTAQPTTTTMARAEGGSITLSSLTDDGTGTLLDMALLILGPETSATVHGERALARDVRSLLNNAQEIVSVVAWHERGRFVTISGSGDVDETLALAATTDEASTSEWATLTAAKSSQLETPPAAIGNRMSANGSFEQVIASMSEVDGSLRLCLEVFGDADKHCNVEPVDELPVLELVDLDGNRLLTAMVDVRDVTPELHVTYTDGTVDIHVLFQPSNSIPGPAVAVFLRDDFESADLFVDGKSVAGI